LISEIFADISKNNFEGQFMTGSWVLIWHIHQLVQKYRYFWLILSNHSVNLDIYRTLPSKNWIFCHGRGRKVGSKSR